MIEVLQGIFFGGYFLIGMFWMIGYVTSDNIKPMIIGDLFGMIIFLPFTILGWIIVLIGLALDVFYTKIRYSKWWNKKLKKENENENS